MFVIGNVYGEFNFAVCCFGGNSQRLHLLKVLAHISINDCVQTINPQTSLFTANRKI